MHCNMITAAIWQVDRSLSLCWAFWIKLYYLLVVFSPHLDVLYVSIVAVGKELLSHCMREEMSVACISIRLLNIGCWFFFSTSSVRLCTRPGARNGEVKHERKYVDGFFFYEETGVEMNGWAEVFHSSTPLQLRGWLYMLCFYLFTYSSNL
jgi:hypothetical protein